MKGCRVWQAFLPRVHPVSGLKLFQMLQVSSVLQRDLPYTLQSGAHSRGAVTHLRSSAFPRISFSVVQGFALSVKNTEPTRVISK